MLPQLQELPILPEHVWAPLAAGDGKAIKTYPNTPQNGKPVVSYVAQQNFNSWSFSLGDFIQDAIKRNCGSGMCLNSSWYLTNVFAGFEIWRGSVGLEVKDFGVTVP